MLNVELVIIVFSTVLSFAAWLEYRHLCRCKIRRNNPYELIDLQEELRKQREEEDARNNR